MLIRAGEDVRLFVVEGAATTTTASASVISGAGMVEEDGSMTGIRRPWPVEGEDE